MLLATPILNRQTSPLTPSNVADLFSDSRTFGYRGPTRSVRIPRATPSGGGSIDKCEDGSRYVVTGNESLRIMRTSQPSQHSIPEHKSATGRGGHRIDASRNFWEGSGLKIDSASTDVAWARGSLNNKILTSARNGELIMWDLNKSGPTKYERRSKDHTRSIHKLAVSHIVEQYCITGSADGDLRVWDLRTFSKSLMRIHHPTSVRSVSFSPSWGQPLQAIVGLDNGSIYRWDLKMGQRGQLDRLPVAHSGPVTSLDWCNIEAANHVGVNPGDTVENGCGWVVSGGLDRCVKVWDLSAGGAHTHIPYKPTYTLHPSFPVRRVIWRPSYECEVAVVSNAEFGTGSNPDLLENATPSSTPQTANNILSHSNYASDRNVSMRDKRVFETKATGGDAIEIWDVRRGWLAKWSVLGSAVEGGVTDMAFGDSHAILAQHSSGVFSQIDLRYSTKPIDTVPRMASAWEPSGGFAFVSDKKQIFEVPFDDIAPEQHASAKELKVKLKALGDSRTMPLTQSFGTYADEHSAQDLEVFYKLAQGYIVTGIDRKSVCATNANVAFQAGRDDAAQIWLLLSSLLSELNTVKIPKASAMPSGANSFLHTSTPTPSYSFPPKAAQNTSPNAASVYGKSLRQGTSSPRRVTPTSSNASSPRVNSNSLPPITPRTPSFLGRRESVDSGLVRRPSTFRRPSISVSAPSAHSASPGERSSSSLRHVGEGALDDSDSSGSGHSAVEESAGVSSDEEKNLRPLISPILAPTRIATVQPSPLSRVASQRHWTEDDDDRDDSGSPSPRSTDTESGGSSSSPQRPKTDSRRSSMRRKTRSRSSTVASLAAQRPVVKRSSHSSIKTVTAGDVSYTENDQKLKNEATIRDLRDLNDEEDRGHKRQPSHVMSDLSLNAQDAAVEEDEAVIHPSDLTLRLKEVISTTERKVHVMGWQALRNALTQFADEGDIQMCAMLAAIVPEELEISENRIIRYFEAYIDLLSRLRLFTSAAYMRKYSRLGEIEKQSQLETTIYTSCGKCRKSLAVAAGAQTSEGLKGGFSYCLSCKTNCVTCAICRLPVRVLYFQCSVCCHGGHQACYQRYYMQRPMVEIPSSLLPINEIRGRSTSRHSPLGLGLEDGGAAAQPTSQTEGNTALQFPRNKPLLGHPCAAGCGHFCWAAQDSRGE